jgi:hypothetical protein
MQVTKIKLEFLKLKFLLNWKSDAAVRLCFFRILATALQPIIMRLLQSVKVRKRRNRHTMRKFSTLLNSEHVIKPAKRACVFNQ